MPLSAASLRGPGHRELRSRFGLDAPDEAAPRETVAAEHPGFDVFAPDVRLYAEQLVGMEIVSGVPLEQAIGVVRRDLPRLLETGRIGPWEWFVEMVVDASPGVFFSDDERREIIATLKKIVADARSRPETILADHAAGVLDYERAIPLFMVDAYAVVREIAVWIAHEEMARREAVASEPETVENPAAPIDGVRPVRPRQRTWPKRS